AAVAARHPQATVAGWARHADAPGARASRRGAITMARARPRTTELARRLAVGPEPGAFTHAETEGLAEPVRRHLQAAIAVGTPLARAARLAMRGRIRLGTRWVPFRARQVIAPHLGFVWTARAGLVFNGSDHLVDGHGGTDFRLLGVVPVAHDLGPDA